MKNVFNKTLVLSILLLSLLSYNCSNKNNMSDTPANFKDNPFYNPSSLPFQAPPFDKIKDSDYQPAIEEGMKQEIEEINKIADNPAEPTFENTLVALEKSGQLLNRAWLTFNAVASANTDSVLQKVKEEEAPKLAAHYDEIYLNPKLFSRVKSVYEKRDQLKLDEESAKTVRILL